MSETRKQIIINEYKILCESIKEIIPDLKEDIFPSLENIDLLDLIFYLNFYFIKEPYEEPIEKLLQMKNIEVNDNQFSELVNIISDFIRILKNL